jgi:ribonuclease T1
MKNKTNLVLIVVLLGLIDLGYNAFTQEKSKQPQRKRPTQTRNAEESKSIESQIPSKAIETWQYIRQHHEAPEGYVGGRVFQNREKKLPKTGPTGEQARYFEWDINPKRKGQNRGPERIVSQDYERAWYTPDHYNTFIRIND